MALGSLLDLLRGKPREPIGPDGRMPLGDHLRELRARILRVAIYLTLGTAAAFFFWNQLFSLIYEPYQNAVRMLDGKVETKAVLVGAGSGLMLQVKLCAMAGVVATSPLWLYEIWAFIVPGLHRNERRWTRVFAMIAGPLFMAGVAVGYYVLPKGLQVLIGFTPERVENLIEFGEYFTFVTRMLLIFGVAFEIPLFVVLLNLAGIVSGKALGRHRPWIIVGTFIFAAVATPSTDPFSMLMLAIPMLCLFVISEIVARVVDSRRVKRSPSALWSDDEASPI